MRILLSTLLIVFCTATLVSCKKEESANTAPPSLVGTWELRKQTGGVGGLTFTYPAGSRYTVNFTATDFTFYDSGQLYHNGFYSILKDNSNADPAAYFLYFNNLPPTDQNSLYLEADRFVFWSKSSSDTYYNTYERIQ